MLSLSDILKLSVMRLREWNGMAASQQTAFHKSYASNLIEFNCCVELLHDNWRKIANYAILSDCITRDNL